MSVKTIDTSLNLMRVFREKVDAFVSTQTVECLLQVARWPGISMAELSDRTGLAQSSCSRNIAALSAWHRLGKPGYGLVEAHDDPRERRRKIIFLTSKGQKLVTEAMRTINADFELNQPSSKEAMGKLYAVGG